MVPGFDPYIDINGDEIPDVAHGELVSAFLKASGKKTIPLNQLGRRDFMDLADLLNPVLAQVKKGKLKISAINLSQLIELKMVEIQQELNVDTSPEALRSKKKYIHDTLRTGMDRRGNSGFRDVSKIFSEFERLGIPIFVAAGNKGPEYINAFSFFPGVISVGSKGIDGTPSLTSAQNGLIQVWRFGEHVLRRTQDGRIDLNNDGIADFEGIKLSNGPNIVERYEGKLLTDLLRSLPTDPDLPQISRETPGGIKWLFDALVDGVYKTEDLISLFRLEDTAFAKALLHRAPYFHKRQNLGFDVDSNGRLVFDPAHDGTRNQAVLVGGTSYATPSICAK
jgi:hypothetical protein